MPVPLPGRRWRLGLIALGAMALAQLGARTAAAQQPPTAPARPAGPAIGSLAPDFTLPGATRYGLLQGPVRLSELRDNTVIIAFFYRARSKG